MCGWRGVACALGASTPNAQFTRYTPLEVVMASVPSERPWKPPLKTIMFCLPVSWRASLMADSTASEPVPGGGRKVNGGAQKKEREQGVGVSLRCGEKMKRMACHTRRTVRRKAEAALPSLQQQQNAATGATHS